MAAKTNELKDPLVNCPKCGIPILESWRDKIEAGLIKCPGRTKN